MFKEKELNTEVSDDEVKGYIKRLKIWHFSFGSSVVLEL